MQNGYWKMFERVKPKKKNIVHEDFYEKSMRQTRNGTIIIILIGIVAFSFLAYLIGYETLKSKAGREFEQVRIGTVINITDFYGYRIHSQTENVIRYSHSKSINDIITDNAGRVLWAGDDIYAGTAFNTLKDK